MSERDAKQDLSVTALYTAGTWAWAGLPGAELFAHDGTRNVFAVTNAALGLRNALRRSPSSLRHTLVQRHVMIDRLVEDAATAHVLELAAGLSRRGAHVSADPAITYTEVDLPHVIARKRALLEGSPAGRAVLARRNLRLVEGDLAAIDLAALGAAPADAPLTIVAEGLLMYLDADAQRGLFRRVRAALPAGGLFVFDLVPMGEQPAPGASGKLLGWLMRRSTGGADFVRDARTRVEVAADLRAAGFEVAMIEPATAPARWGVPHLDQPTQQLVFAAWVPSGDRTFVRADAGGS
jgi:O-methyltransferase involved in polyketide biosynthesis